MGPITPNGWISMPWFAFVGLTFVTLVVVFSRKPWYRPQLAVVVVVNEIVPATGSGVAEPPREPLTWPVRHAGRRNR